MIHQAQEVTKTVRLDGEIDAVVVRIQQTGSADTDYPVVHGLGRVPVGCQVILSDKAVNVYKGTVWNTENVYLKFDVADCDVNVRIW